MRNLDNIYNIPADWNFTHALAQGVIDQTAMKPENMAKIKILLPTRRSCRELANAFLNITKGKSLILPIMHPIGDIDSEELELKIASDTDYINIIDIPPAIPPIKRQLLLASLVRKLPEYHGNIEQSIKLSLALCKLMDQIYAENLSLSDMKGLVSDEFAEHWQITIDFLSILEEHWPKILTSYNFIDGADRRNRILNLQSDYWERNNPDYRIIAAGSTGTIPAVARLLNVISKMPKGTVIIPGLDTNIDHESWDNLEPTHPQYAIKSLLNILDVPKENVSLWPYKPDSTDWNKDGHTEAHNILASEIMRPSVTINKWQDIKDDRIISLIVSENKSLQRVECHNEEEEAALIALVMRESLENPDKTCCLVTPDRFLARRVAVSLKKWGIDIDDSGGYNLSDSVVGSFIRLVTKSIIDGFSPISFISLLKHRLASGGLFSDNYRSVVRLIDKYLLRGKSPDNKNIYGLLELLIEKQFSSYVNISDEIATEIKEFLLYIEQIYEDLNDNNNERKSINHWIDKNLEIAEALASQKGKTGADKLWAGENGEAAAEFFINLKEQAEFINDITLNEYYEIISSLMKQVMIRPKFGMHPRLSIIGLMESRLFKADRMIISGLNENVWPPEIAHDPWMSRPMRKAYNLPEPEMAIGSAAHDFVSCLCSPEIIMTRSKNIGNSPSVPSRWLQRLDTIIKSIEKSPDVLNNYDYQHILETITSNNSKIIPCSRPEPKPDVKYRPKKLSVTEIEKWMIDPYSIYAKHILRLRPLDDIEKNTDAAEIGTITHKIFERFISENKKNIPEDSKLIIHKIANEVIGEKINEKGNWIFWQQRFDKISDWFIANEKIRRKSYQPFMMEQSGTMTVSCGSVDFTLSVKADRLDLSVGGEQSIIDYKTGTPPTKTEIKSGRKPQLPLTALIAQNGGFTETHDTKIASMEIWSMTGSNDGGTILHIDATEEPSELKEIIDNAENSLIDLVNVFNNNDTPYYSIPNGSILKLNDYLEYNHLARVSEWSDSEVDA